MNSYWLNVRIGRYFVHGDGRRLRLVRMDDAWMRLYGRPFVKVWVFPGLRR